MWNLLSDQESALYLSRFPRVYIYLSFYGVYNRESKINQTAVNKLCLYHWNYTMVNECFAEHMYGSLFPFQAQGKAEALGTRFRSF